MQGKTPPDVKKMSSAIAPALGNLASEEEKVLGIGPFT